MISDTTQQYFGESLPLSRLHRYLEYNFALVGYETPNARIRQHPLPTVLTDLFAVGTTNN